MGVKIPDPSPDCSLAVRPSSFRGGEKRGDAVDIAAEQGREIGVDHGGVAAADELDQRADLVADRDLGEARLAGEARGQVLMVRMRISMHEHDGHGIDAVVPGSGERIPQHAAIERRLDGAVGMDALGHLDHPRVKHRRLLDVAREDLGPRLVADLERVAETRR